MISFRMKRMNYALIAPAIKAVDVLCNRPFIICLLVQLLRNLREMLWTRPRKDVIMSLDKKERGIPLMLKKLASLLLSLLLCLSLLPGQAQAENLPDPADPPVVEEPLDPETPEKPEEPLMPLSDEFPNEGDNSGHIN